MKHQFGGIWTRLKLSILSEYLSVYTTALRNIFTLHFVDAFAGTGKQSLKVNDMQGDFLPEEDFDGSVRQALEVKPSFHHYHFNDLKPEYTDAIKTIAKEYPDQSILVTQKDANQFIPDFCAKLGSGDRAMLFLDPFSTELSWETLKHVANSKKIDL